MIEAFRVASGDVAGHAFIESEAGKQTVGARQALLAILAFLFHRAKGWRTGQVERVWCGYGHRYLVN